MNFSNHQVACILCLAWFWIPIEADNSFPSDSDVYKDFSTNTDVLGDESKFATENPGNVKIKDGYNGITMGRNIDYPDKQTGPYLLDGKVRKYVKLLFTKAAQFFDNFFGRNFGLAQYIVEKLDDLFDIVDRIAYLQKQRQLKL